MTAERRRSAEAAIAAAFGRGEPVFLAFSGGKDSLALLRLCEPYEGRFKLLWSNTGYTFPHVETLIRRLGERFGLAEVRADLKANWQLGGLPTEILTSESFTSRNADLQLQPWNMCCYASKAIPLEHFCTTHQGPMVLLNGQRAADGWRFAGRELPPHVTALAPLVDWSTDDVFDFVEAAGIELPAHYAEVRDSLDCWICPATWSASYAPAFGRYMAREYPELMREAIPNVLRIHGQMLDVLSKTQQALEAAA